MSRRLLTSTAMVLALSGFAGAYAQTDTPTSPSTTQAPTAPAPAPSTQAPATQSPTATTQAPPAAAPKTQPSGSATAEGLVTQQQENQVRANTIIGMRVKNPQDENIGKINDLLLDENGSVSAAVLSVGGFLGIGDKLVAVPWQQVKIDSEHNSATVAMNKEQLTSAPAFKTKESAQADREAEASRQRAREQPQRPGGAPAGAPR